MNALPMHPGKRETSSMNKQRRRILFYAAIGLIFGVLDWFYLDWLAHLSWGSLGQSVVVVPIILILNYGIWLVPVIPIAIYEARRAQRITSPIAASVITWLCAMVGYYGFYALQLSLGKLPSYEHLNIFGEKYPGFWLDFSRIFNRVILSQFLEWTLIAIVCGSILGAIIFKLFRQKPAVGITQKS